MKKPVTINDLKELEQNDVELSPQQRLAIKNFERYKFTSLSGIKKEDKFHKEFQRIQSLANLSKYEEFLKEKYL